MYCPLPHCTSLGVYYHNNNNNNNNNKRLQLMAQCTACDYWFHQKCLNIPKSEFKKQTMNSWRFERHHSLAIQCYCCYYYVKERWQPSIATHIHRWLASHSTIGSKECTPTLFVPYSTIGTTHISHTPKGSASIGVEECRGTLFVPYSSIGGL